MEEKEHVHITPYTTHLKILVILLCMTTITITVTVIDLAAWSVGVALLIACVKVGIVMAYFMHLKYEKILLRSLAIGVMLLFAVVLVMTFFDYLYR